MAAKKKSSPAYEFIIAFLKKKKNATFKEIKEAGAKKRLKIVPISYGRAQAQLGIVKSKPKKKKAKRAATKRKASARVGRPRKTRSSASLDSLESLITGLKDVQRDRDDLRAALEKVRDILDRVL